MPVKTSMSARSIKAAIAAVVMLGAVPAVATTASAAEVTVTIERVNGRGPGDLWSRSDFFARVTIDGVTTTTDVVRNQNNATPNWTITREVRRGIHDIKIEILDKDVTKQESIDITRTPSKKDLDFRANTRTCSVLGFAEGYRCGQSIVREGDEGKSAEITFRVDMKR